MVFIKVIHEIDDDEKNYQLLNERSSAWFIGKVDNN